MHRLFVAIRPPEPVRDLLIDAMDDSADFRWQDDEQLHLTLRFIGEVDRPVADDIAAALTRIRAERFECASPASAASSSAAAAPYGQASSPRRRSPRSPPRSSASVRGRSGTGAPRLPSPHHPCPLEGPPHARTRRLPRSPPRPEIGPVRCDGVQAVRKPPLPSRRALRGNGELPAAELGERRTRVKSRSIVLPRSAGAAPMSAITSHSRKYAIALAACLTVAASVYGFARFSPAYGPIAGSITPQMYVDSLPERADPDPRPLCPGRCRVGPAVHDRGRPRPGFDEGHRRQARNADPGAEERHQLRDAEPLLARDRRSHEDAHRRARAPGRRRLSQRPRL